MKPNPRLEEALRRILQLERLPKPYVVAANATAAVEAEASTRAAADIAEALARAAADAALDSRLTTAEADIDALQVEATDLGDALLDEINDRIAGDASLASSKADKTTQITAGNGVAIETGGTLAGTTRVGLTLDGTTLSKSATGVKVNSIDDTIHGNRGGGSLHALAVAGGANGFLSGTDKTKLDNTSNTNSGDVTWVAPSGSNANGVATVSGQQFRLTFADATNPGIWSTGAQSFTGIKTIETGSGQFVDTLKILASTHATSRRAASQWGSWEFGQDRQGNGTLDFFFWKVGDTNAAVALSTSGGTGAGSFGPPVTNGSLDAGTTSLRWGTLYTQKVNANVAGSSITPNAWNNFTTGVANPPGSGALGLGWTLLASPYGAARYRLNIFGDLELQVQVQYPGATTKAWQAIIANLPVGFRPTVKARIGADSGLAGTNDKYCSIDIDPNGNIIVINSQQNTGTTTTFIAFTVTIPMN